MIQIGRIKLSNKICIAPGSYPSETSFVHAGAIFSKTITLEKNNGNNGELVRDLGFGLINRVGLSNCGALDFIKKELFRLKELNENLIVSIAGNNLNEIIDLCAILAFECRDTISGIELNLSCPNKKIIKNLDNSYLYDVVSETKKVLKSIHDLPLIVKLPPWPDHIAGLGIAAEDAGADAITATNTIKALHFDDQDTPILGGLSGKALKPISLRCVYELRREINLPIFGLGGIETLKDVNDFIEAGANAVQLCTAEIKNPGTLLDILIMHDLTKKPTYKQANDF